MKVVILAGGFGTRLSEETDLKPKPMVEIGGKPILWHIMKIYSHYGFNDFVICLGYKGYMIKEWFANYFLHNSDVTINLKKNKMEVHTSYLEPWIVTLVDTGIQTQIGGRMKRVEKYIGGKTFMMTYGDGLSDINIKELVKFHKSHDSLATVTSVQPEGRFGAIKLNGNQVVNFGEKSDSKCDWINGGFFVLEPEVIDYIKDESTVWEREPLERLANDGKLMAYTHQGFWKPMDKLIDKIKLEEMWNSGNPPWKVWKE